MVFPGGSGNGQAKAIGAAGIEAVRNHVRGGGGYIGTCGGAFLGLSHIRFYGDGPAGNGPVTQEPWDRGHGVVQIEFTAQGRSELLLEASTFGGNVSIMYWQGPIVKDKDLPTNVTRLGYFRTEIHTGHPGRSANSSFTSSFSPSLSPSLFFISLSLFLFFSFCLSVFLFELPAHRPPTLTVIVMNQEGMHAWYPLLNRLSLSLSLRVPGEIGLFCSVSSHPAPLPHFSTTTNTLLMSTAERPFLHHVKSAERMPLESPPAIYTPKKPPKTLYCVRSTTGEMVNTPAITSIDDFGKGRVVLNSPHPELAPHLPAIYAGELHWIARLGVSKAPTKMNP